ncbi:hypothetical protein [Actinokineospora bangkokensis]|uniref:hypothetical protein n=1 Tax=Actinokineospora bangkokensis TaxID=1193682 RepID=UPI00117794F3|nr:hypothetical protein [Actinokineospora bangkokensis]
MQNSTGLPMGAVGIAAVAVGVGGIVVGLFRRKKAPVSAANARVEPVVQQVQLPLQVPAPRSVVEPVER